MTRKREPTEPTILPEHESGVRSLTSEARGQAYVAYRTLAEAQHDPHGIVVFEGDYGGQIYAVARASFVRCPVEQLHRLLTEIDAAHWGDPDGARVYFESSAPGAGIAGGMGGGLFPTDLWVHPKLEVSSAAIRAVLIGEKSSLGV